MASFLLPAAISTGSSLISRAVTDTPDVPDLTGQAIEEVNRARRTQREEAEDQRRDLEESLAARGAGIATAGSAREEMFDAQASAAAELESRAADIISDAIREEKMLEFEQDQRRARNRAGAISEIGSGLAQAAIASDTGFSDLFGSEGGGSGPPTGTVDPGAAGEVLSPEFTNPTMEIPGDSPLDARGLLDAIQLGR